MSEPTPVILLVEDNEDDVLITERAVRKSDADVRLEVARDGDTALDALYSDTPPQLVLLDINMPGITGFDVLERVKGDPHRCRLPVVMLTSSTRESDVARAYDLGANSYLIKPVDYSEFVKMLQVLMDYWFKVGVLPPAPVAPVNQ